MQFAGGKVENIDMIALEKAVRANDALALEIWEEIALRNAQAFGMLMNTFNPKRLILGTFGWAIGELYTEPIKKYLPRFAWAETLAQCEIVSSELPPRCISCSANAHKRRPPDAHQDLFCGADRN